LFGDAGKAGWDGAWIRQRYLEHEVGSAAVFLAAAGQRTHRIELGTAVIPIGYESPFRLAEDLSLADVLSRGRPQIGFSSSMPHAEILGDLVYDGDWRSFDLQHGRIARLAETCAGTSSATRTPSSTRPAMCNARGYSRMPRAWWTGSGTVPAVRARRSGQGSRV
jgi:alkanesulfonate monooxygenase SsuD/methylene tetrahydromethanopterin reductase-like flavin-dependent oxidoreductase (luciferase family)